MCPVYWGLDQYPLYLLLELATNKGEDEVYVSRTISREVTFRFINILTESFNTRRSLKFVSNLGKRGKYWQVETVYPFKPYIHFFKGLYSNAVRNESEYLVESYLNDLYLLFLELIRLKVSPVETRDLLDSFKESILMLSEKGMKKSFDYALSLLEKILVSYFEYNCPKGFYISDFRHIYGDHLYYIENREEDFKWGVLRDSYVYSIKDILKTNNLESKAEFYSSALYTYSGFMSEIERINHLDIYQKRHLLFILHSDMVFELEKSYSQWKEKSLLSYVNCKPFGSFINAAIKKDAFYLKDYFTNAGNYFYELSEKFKLTAYEVWQYSILLYQTLSRSHQSVSCDKGFYFLLEILLEVKMNMEEDVDINAEGYIEISKTLNVLQKKINKNFNFSKYQRVIEAAVDSIKNVSQINIKGNRFKWNE